MYHACFARSEYKIIFVCFFVPFLFLLAFYSEIPSLARTQVIHLVSHKWRSIALISIMHVYKCMQIKQLLDNIITKNFPSSLIITCIYIYIFVFFSYRSLALILMVFISECKCINVCVFEHLAACTCVCMRAYCMCMHACIYVNFAIIPQGFFFFDFNLSYETYTNYRKCSRKRVN